MTVSAEVQDLARGDLDLVLQDLQDRWYGDPPPPDHFDGEVAAAMAAVCRSTAEARSLLAAGEETSRAAAAQVAPHENRDVEVTGSNLRVVLMGRTQAGKSTLLAAMTRLPEHVERIGRGAQRTSRDSAEGPWHRHPEITIVDPPGIGAAGGEEDTEVAFDTVRDADLVVWVQSNDSSQQASLDAITQLCVLGKPMLLVLNFRQDLSRPSTLDRFLRRPELTFRHESGHLARLGRHLDELGASWSTVVCAHLGAAMLASHGHPRSEELRAGSGVGPLEDALLAELKERAPIRRLLNPVDRCRSGGELALEASLGAEHRTRGEADVLRRLADDLHRRNRRSVAKLEEEARAQVRVVIAQRAEWHATRSLDGIGSAWEDEQRALDEELDDLLRWFAVDLDRQVDADREVAATEWTAFAGDRSTLPTGSSAWVNKAAKIATNLPALAPLVVSNPVTLGIAAVGIGVKLLFGKQLNRWIDRATHSREALALLHRDSVGKQIAQHLTAIERQALARLDELADAERARQDDERRTGLDRSEAREQAAGDLAGVSTDLRGSLTDLDTATVRALLALAGRPRVAASIVRAARRPGIAMVAGASPAGHEESVLFPVGALGEPAAIVAHPRGDPPLHSAFEGVFKLSGAMPAGYAAYGHGATVALGIDVPDGLRLAWETILSSYTDATIHLQ